MRSHARPALLALALAACRADSPLESALPQASVAPAFPDVIALPDGFWPEGIDFGTGTTFFVGSLASGAILRGDAASGATELLVPPHPGREEVGMKYDARTDRLYVAGGFSGEAYVYDASTGAELAVYPLADPADGLTLVNDLVITVDAAYFTDTFRNVIYRLPLRTDGALPAPGAAQTVPLTGDADFVPGDLNWNGITALPGGDRLIVLNTVLGSLHIVDPQSGAATRVDLGGESVQGDGILLLGRTLYVVQGPLDQIAVVQLAADFASGYVERVITDPAFQFPSTVARFGSSLYVVNARLDVPPEPDVEYSIVRVSR